MFLFQHKPVPKSKKRLDQKFYERIDVERISKELLGKVLVTQIEGQRTSGTIVETEAYRGPDDKACHAHLNRFTKRTKVMFDSGGHAYIYLCYGIHHLFNVVTAKTGMPHAVLIRAIEPLENMDLMLSRRNMTRIKPQLTAGPGVLSKAMGLNKDMTGQNMLDTHTPVWIEDWGFEVAEKDIVASPRVGIDYAEECIDWPWRFRVKGSKWTSPAK